MPSQNFRRANDNTTPVTERGDLYNDKTAELERVAKITCVPPLYVASDGPDGIVLAVQPQRGGGGGADIGKEMYQLHQMVSDHQAAWGRALASPMS